MCAIADNVFKSLFDCLGKRFHRLDVGVDDSLVPIIEVLRRG